MTLNTKMPGQQARATLLGLILALSGAMAAETGNIVDVDGVWGISEKGTASEGADCDRWASGRGSSAGAVSDTDPGIQDEATDDANHIRYGAADVNADPPPCLGFADQSGFAFWGEAGISLPVCKVGCDPIGR